jgi:hypothetical protein
LRAEVGKDQRAKQNGRKYCNTRKGGGEKGEGGMQGYSSLVALVVGEVRKGRRGM